MENAGLPAVTSGFLATPKDQRDHKSPAQPQVGLTGQLPLQNGGQGGESSGDRELLSRASCP